MTIEDLHAIRDALRANFLRRPYFCPKHNVYWTNDPNDACGLCTDENGVSVSAHQGWAADDFETIRSRMKQIKESGKPPPFTTGSSTPGSHCPWCPLPAAGPCSMPCSTEYKKAYGIDPYGTTEERRAAGTMPPEAA